MKLLIVNSHLEIGGILNSLLNLLDIIHNFDIDVDLQLLKYDANLGKQYDQLKEVKLLQPIRVLNAYKTSLSSQKGFFNKAIKIIFSTLSKLIGGKCTTNLMMFFVPKSGQYDVAISFSNDIWTSYVGGFCGGCNDYVIKKVNAKKKIAWIHNEAEKLGYTYDICENTYEKFDVIVNVSYACKKMFDKIIPKYQDKSKVVYNMFNIDRINCLSNIVNPYESEKFQIVTVARLDNQQKRIDKIISCCEKLLADNITNFQWHIVGDGSDRVLLSSLSNEKETNDVIIFEGRKNNPYPYMKYADIFVLVSDYEAYGMVLTESIITGTPVISTNFLAASEVINRNKNGIIVDNDVESIFITVKELIQTPDIIRQMRKYIDANKIDNNCAIQQFIDVIGEY